MLTLIIGFAVFYVFLPCLYGIYRIKVRSRIWIVDSSTLKNL